jgi:F-type H+/Na+-transporting ATPase subunit alpha
MIGAECGGNTVWSRPYVACTIGESFMHHGRNVLAIYDSLTDHADAYGRIALLLGQPPGREAYPPDVFYLHTRFLERATQLRD